MYIPQAQLELNEQYWNGKNNAVSPSDSVNHPKHYQKPGRKECIQEMIDKYGRSITADFCLGNAYKYIYRAGEKDGSSKKEDIAKANWYITFVEQHLFSAVTSKGAIQLYRDIKQSMRKYVQ